MHESGASKLKISNLVFHYGTEDILKDLSFEVPSGSFFSILGPNGVGKSTLIKCMCSILRPKSGTIHLDTLNIREMDLRQLSRKIGYTGQHLAVRIPVSVFDLVMLGRRPYQRLFVSNSEREKVWSLLAELGISDYANRPLSELSGGKQQLVHIASSLAQEPEVLLLDEPTSNFDMLHQLEVLRKLKNKTREDGLTVVAAIHDVNLAVRFSDCILMLKEGTAFRMGEPEAIITEENIKTLYGLDAEVITHKGCRHVVPSESYS
jgi:iron complex transport system ATP-binding protein